MPIKTTRQEQLLKQVVQDSTYFWSLGQPGQQSRDQSQDAVCSIVSWCLRVDRNEVHQIILRRVSCVIIYLVAKLIPCRWSPPLIAKLLHKENLFVDQSEADLEKDVGQFVQAGDRYLNIAFALGSLEVVWWLPIEVSRTV